MKITDSPTIQKALIEAYASDIEEFDDLDPNSDEARGVDPDARWQNRWDD